MYSSFYSGIASELLSKLRRLATFTGHTGSIGLHHEEIVKEMIRPILSERFSLRSGFIYSGPGLVSKQCDLIIIDEHDPSPYFFQMGNLVVVHPRAVAAVIEIKTKLTKETFHDALSNLHQSRVVSRAAKVDRTFMTFIFAYEGIHFDIDPLDDWYKSAPVPDYFDAYPQMIYVLQEGSLDLKRFDDGVFGHRFIIGEEEDELKSRSLSAFLQSIRKTLEHRAGIETNPFEFADLSDLAWSRQYHRIGVGVVDPGEENGS